MVKSGNTLRVLRIMQGNYPGRPKSQRVEKKNNKLGKGGKT